MLKSVPKVVTLYVSGLFFAGLCGVAAAQGGAGRPAPVVTVQTITEGAVTPPTERIARVEAQEAVELRARVTGFLDSIDFKPGAYVKQGDLLFSIEPARFQAAVAAAEAQVARADATRKLARDTLARNAELVRQNAMARVSREEAQTALDVAQAELAAAQANLAKEALDLSYTRITAPLSGRIGQSTFSIGNLVGPDSGSLARLVQMDPVRVVFSVTQGEMVTLRQAAGVNGTSQREALHLRVRLPNGELYDQEGTLEFVGPEVDVRTATAAVRALFPNPAGLLMPGQSVRLISEDREVETGPLVAQSAVLQDRAGRFVYIVDEGNVARQRRIETGAKIGDRWAVQSGVKLGETVVVQGVQRLSDGMLVQPQPQEGGARQ